MFVLIIGSFAKNCVIVKSDTFQEFSSESIYIDKVLLSKKTVKEAFVNKLGFSAFSIEIDNFFYKRFYGTYARIESGYGLRLT